MGNPLPRLTEILDFEPFRPIWEPAFGFMEEDLGGGLGMEVLAGSAPRWSQTHGCLIGVRQTQHCPPCVIKDE